MIISLSTAADRRFVNDRGEFNADYVRDNPALAARTRDIRRELRGMAFRGEVLELRFWIKELKRKQEILPPAAFNSIIRKIRSMNAGLPEDLRIQDIDQMLEIQSRRHALAHARNLFRRLSELDNGEASNFDLRRTEFRRYLRRVGVTLEDLDSSEQDLHRMAGIAESRSILHYQRIRQRRALRG